MKHLVSLSRGFAALLLLALAPMVAQAQTSAVGIGTAAPHASAALDVSSTSKGLLPPRMTTSQRNAIASPAAGLTLFNTDTNKLNTWNGTAWAEALTGVGDPVPGTSVTFNYTGGPQTYTVPVGSISLRVEVVGARGGGSLYSSSGIYGGVVQGTMVVTPGEVLTLYVGGAGNNNGAGGYNGGGTGYSGTGGGGGASDIRRGAAGLADRVIVAGGGGGNGNGDYGGGGGYNSNGDGRNGWGVGGGLGGSTGSGGAGGNGGSGGTVGTAGALGQGGNGNGNAAAGPYYGGGGGGGGYYGGGGGGTPNPATASYAGGGGGGGSSYSDPATATGSFFGNYSNYPYLSYITITPMVLPGPVLNGANIVNVPGTWQVSGNNVYRGTGNVGIGTSSPGAGLHVSTPEKPAVSGAAGVYLSGGASGSPNMELRSSGGATYIDFAHDQSADFTARLFSNSSGLAFHTGGNSAPRLLIDPTGNLTLSSLAGTGTRMLVTNANGLLSSQALPPGDNLGNHLATQNLNLAGYKLVGNGGTTGLGISSNGNVGIAGAADIGGATTIGGTATIGGATTIGGAATVSGGATVGGTVGIGTTSPAASAALEVSSTTKGFLPPRLSLGQRDAIASPATGLTIYNTTTGRLNTWNGTRWDAGLNDVEQPYQSPAATFGFTGGPQTYTVPAGVTSLLVEATGARGGGTLGGSRGGWGAQVRATLAVTPGEVLTLYVGGTGETVDRFSSYGGAGYNGGGNGSATQGNDRGGGGGGATDVRRSATAPSTALTERLLVAAGGGGGGIGGGGGSGGAPNGSNGSSQPGYTAGTGATQSTGGSVNGGLGQGGSAPSGQGGGGGGGYYGGGATNAFAGGGGGSSWVTPTGSSGVVMTAGAGGSSGGITLTPGLVYASPALDGSNFVNVPGDNLGNHTATQALNLGANQLVGNGGSTGLAISSSGNVGIGTASPVTQLANSAVSVIATDGNGVSSQALNWVSTTTGYAAGLANTNAAANGHGLAVKVASAHAATAALDISQGSTLGAAGTSLLRVRGDGSVGVGTTNPTQKLDVEGGILARSNGPITNQGAHLQWNRSGGEGETWLLNQQGGGGGGMRFGAATTANVATEWARFDGRGNLGLGTPNPNYKLEVNGTALINSGYDLLIRDTQHGLGWYGAGKPWGSATPDGPVLYGYTGGILGTRDGGTTAVLAWNKSGRVGIGTTNPQAALHVTGTVLVGGGSPPTTGNATGLGWNAVNVNMGETELYNYRGLGSGGFRFFSVGGNSGTPSSSNQVAFINTAGAYSALSDRRVKTNITPLAQGLRAVLALRPVSYDFHPSRQLKDGVVTFLPDDQPVRALGFVAQDLYQVVPEAVEKPKDDEKEFYTVSYTTLVPVLTQAIQEQQAQIEELKKQNAALQGQAKALEARAATAETQAATTEADHASLLTLQAQMARLLGEGTQARK